MFLKKNKNKNKYNQINQFELQTVYNMVKFWLENCRYFLMTTTDSSFNKVSVNKTILTDFLELYEINKPLFQYISNNVIQIRELTIILNPLEKYNWYIQTVDKKGNLSSKQITPTILGISILGMFSKIIYKEQLDPDIIMSICYYYDYHLIS